MKEIALRFGIQAEDGRRAATWKLWTHAKQVNSDVYLTCRSLGGVLKASLHESGEWHIAYSQCAYEDHVEGAISRFTDRFVEKWPRPAETHAGITLAFRILTPASSPTVSVKDADTKGVFWIANARAGKAIEVYIYLLKPSVVVTNWPGKQGMGTSLIGSFRLGNGDSVWAVYRQIAMPTLSPAGPGQGQYFKGRSRADIDKALSEGSLRCIAFGQEPDGSRVLYDCAVERRKPADAALPSPAVNQ